MRPAATPGSCRCTAAQEPAPARVATPDYAAAMPPPALPLIPPPLTPVGAPPAGAKTPVLQVGPTEQKVVEYSRLADASEAHPVAPPAKEVSTVPPPTSDPVYTAVLPPLTFMAGSPLPPPTPEADMVMLIREAHVSPEWEFSGRVETPDFAKEMQHALGEKQMVSPTAAATAQSQDPAADKPKKKGGFWSALKRAFGGGTVSAAGK